MKKYTVMIVALKKSSNEEEYYLVDVDADNRVEAKSKAIEDISDYLRDELLNEFGFIEEDPYDLKAIYIPNDTNIRRTLSQPEIMASVNNQD